MIASNTPEDKMITIAVSFISKIDLKHLINMNYNNPYKNFNKKITQKFKQNIKFHYNRQLKSYIKRYIHNK